MWFSEGESYYRPEEKNFKNGIKNLSIFNAKLINFLDRFKK